MGRLNCRIFECVAKLAFLCVGWCCPMFAPQTATALEPGRSACFRIMRDFVEAQEDSYRCNKSWYECVDAACGNLPDGDGHPACMEERKIDEGMLSMGCFERPLSNPALIHLCKIMKLHRDEVSQRCQEIRDRSPSAECVSRTSPICKSLPTERYDSIGSCITISELTIDALREDYLRCSRLLS